MFEWLPHYDSFSSFALSDPFLAISRASGSVFMFCAPDPFSAVPRAPGPVFMFGAPELVLGGTEGIRSCFRVLCSRTRFRWYRGSQVLF
jgi:hypothetical protein